MKKTFQLGFMFCSVAIASSCGSTGDGIETLELFPVKTGDTFQYIDREGKIVINPQFGDATIFRENVALVRSSDEDSKWGFIGKDGNYLISPTFKRATIFSEGLAWVVQENGAPFAVNKNGETEFKLENAERVEIFKEGFAAYSITDSTGEKWGFVDREGKTKINPQFAACEGFSEGKSAVANEDDLWGFIDTEGKLIINYQFSEVRSFQDGMAIASIDDKYGVIDEGGKFIINPQFDMMRVDGDGFMIEQNDKSGWCDADGKITINPQFVDAHPFGNRESAPAKSGDSWGYVDREGKFAVNPQFDLALPFNGDRALVVSNQKLGVIGADGLFVVNPQFDFGLFDAFSSDLYWQLTWGRSLYERVETDFFNVDQIVARMNIEQPEGLTLASKISDVMSVFGVTPESFSLSAIEHEVLEREEISRDAELTFAVLADVSSVVPSGWYSETRFNPDANLQGLVYMIKVKGRGEGKGPQVLDAIASSLKGYTKKEVDGERGLQVFESPKQQVRLFMDGEHGVIVLIQATSSGIVEDAENAAAPVAAVE